MVASGLPNKALDLTGPAVWPAGTAGRRARRDGDLGRLTGVRPMGRGTFTGRQLTAWPAWAAKRTHLVSRKYSSMILALSLLSCTGVRPTNLGVHGSVLAPCPSSPNCVSSDAKDSFHQVAAFQLALSAADAWPVVREAVASIPRTVIVTETPDYLHAECSSAIFGFVDDLELHLRTAQGSIAVRSASRLGYGDLGVNRRRVENLREVLAQQGVVR